MKFTITSKSPIVGPGNEPRVSISLRFTDSDTSAVIDTVARVVVHPGTSFDQFNVNDEVDVPFTPSAI